MAASAITLTSSMRTSLFQLQSSAKIMGRTQGRLATGRRVNSALDDPINFFAAQGHRNRARDLMARKDMVTEAIKCVAAADNGIGAIADMLAAAKGLAGAALATNDEEERGVLAAQFDEVLDQIDTLAADAGYRGTDLLQGDSLTTDFAAASGASTLTIAGVDASSGGLALDKAAQGETTTTVIPSSIDSIDGGSVTDNVTVGETVHTTDGASHFAFSADMGPMWRLFDLTTGGIATHVSVNGPSISHAEYGGTVVSGSFNAGDEVRLEQYAHGVDQDTGIPNSITTTIPESNAWETAGGIQASLSQLDHATTSIRAYAKQLATNSGILTTRLDYLGKMGDILETGADSLTLADMNEEGASMLMLQTRQRLGFTSLNLAAKGARSVMQLF